MRTILSSFAPTALFAHPSCLSNESVFYLQCEWTNALCIRGSADDVRIELSEAVGVTQHLQLVEQPTLLHRGEANSTSLGHLWRDAAEVSREAGDSIDVIASHRLSLRCFLLPRLGAYALTIVTPSTRTYITLPNSTGLFSGRTVNGYFDAMSTQANGVADWRPT